MMHQGREATPSNGASAARAFFETVLQNAGGDIVMATDSISEPRAALVFAFGYEDQLSEAGVAPHEEGQHVRVGIYGHLKESCGDDTALLAEKQALWKPALEFIALKQEFGSRWEVIREAVHFADEAGDSFLRGGL